MLRSLVLIFMLANAAFYAWSQGWLNDLVGVQPDAQHDPARLSAQKFTDKLLVIPPELPNTPNTPASAPTSPLVATAASTADSASANAPVCLEAGPFTPEEFTQVRVALHASLPPQSWRHETVSVQGLWMVYMGPYADPDLLARKQTELRRIKGLKFEVLKTPANLAHGLSLGLYPVRAEAEANVKMLKQRGVRSAHTINMRPPLDVQVVRVPEATPVMQTALSHIKLPQSKDFTACR